MDDVDIDERSRGVRWLFRCLAAALGLAQIVVARHTVGPDARSYLEIARAILRHDWAMTINAYWSPLYSWLLAGAMGIVQPSLRQEFPLAHFVAFPVWLACIAAFEFLWSGLLRLREVSREKLQDGNSFLPSAQIWALGYALFIWLAVGGLITAINPDLCMTAVVLLSAGLLVRMDMEPNQKSLYVWMGICLGIGYLVKAILFPMGLVFLAMVAVIGWRSGAGRWRRFAVSGFLFAAIVLPQIILLSRAKGRPTFSDTGKLAFAWYTYHLPLTNWEGQPPGSGTPLHPTRQLNQHPDLYEFNGPLRSSYPPWYDPSYWNDGLAPGLQAGIVASHVLHDVEEVFLIVPQPAAWAFALVLLLLGCDYRRTLRGMAAGWFLIAIVATVTGMYCVTLMESRYLAPWELLFWGTFLCGIRFRRTLSAKAGFFYLGVTILASLVMVTSIARLVYGENIHGFHNDASAEYATAEGLLKSGLQPGAKVGAIGFDNDAYWGYLAHVDIVAEIPTSDTCSFWSEPMARQNELLEKFARAGATAVVVNTGGGIRTTSRAVPLDLAGCAKPEAGWRAIVGSPNHVYFF